jgi:hypothetical protein
MKPIKKIISDAFSGKDEVNNDKNQLTPELQAFIKKEIDSQIQTFLRESLIPEIRKTITETLHDEMQRLNLSASNFQESPRKIEDFHQEELPLVLEEDILPLDEKLSQIIKSEADSAAKPTLSINNIRLGIDFGTSTTAVSLRIGNEQPQALPIGRNGELYIPSVVYFRPGDSDLRERVLVGEDAEAMNNETRVIRSIKRCFGCEGGNCEISVVQ